MTYQNAESLLPSELLREIQKYAQGSLLYIPAPGDSRLGWGRKNGTRQELDRRNAAIRAAKASGRPVKDLAEEYNLSTDGIRKILASA